MDAPHITRNKSNSVLHFDVVFIVSRPRPLRYPRCFGVLLAVGEGLNAFKCVEYILATTNKKSVDKLAGEVWHLMPSAKYFKYP